MRLYYNASFAGKMHIIRFDLRTTHRDRLAGKGREEVPLSRVWGSMVLLELYTLGGQKPRRIITFEHFIGYMIPTVGGIM